MNFFAKIFMKGKRETGIKLEFLSQSQLRFCTGDFCIVVGYEYLFGEEESIQIFMDQLSIPVPKDRKESFELRRFFRALEDELRLRGFEVLWSFPMGSFWPWPFENNAPYSSG